MEGKRSGQGCVFLWVMAAVLLQNLVVSVLSEMSFEDEKNFFPMPDPHALTPPAVSFTPPAVALPPPTPSHGGGSHGGTPPSHCGNPPSGGHHHPTPSPPTSGGGSYHHSPPTSTPSTPTIGTPPVTITPPTPTTTFPSPPSSFDPNSPPFTCTYWRNHPTLIWGLIGWWGTVGSSFGVSSLPGAAPHTSLLEALSNTRTDGYGDLYREGTAALLNSMAHAAKFPYTTPHVRDSFVAALGSNKAATAQAQLFKLANEGRIRARE